MLIAINPKFTVNISKFVTLDEYPGHCIGLDLEIQGSFFTIINIYAPNKDSPDFFDAVENRIRDGEINKIIMGDYNLTFDNDLDRCGTINNNNKKSSHSKSHNGGIHSQ